MRRRIVLLCLVIICLFLLFFRRQGTEPRDSAVTDSSPPVRSQETIHGEATSPNAAAAPRATTSPVTPTISPAQPTNEFLARILPQWQAQIDFYGEVVDENDHPISGANVQFSWSETPMDERSRMSSTESDANGRFELHDARGPSLDVRVSKAGYYTSPKDSWSFAYAINGHFNANSASPEIFHLRKKGQGVNLITSANGIQTKAEVRVPKDDSPVRLDFFQKQASPGGQLEIRQNKPPWNTATEWSFSMSIPDGGFVENQDEFQFQAPETNYQPTVTYHFTKGNDDWTTHFTKSYYIAFGQPRQYGWLQIESDLAQETVFFSYAINPDGSRNLESN